MNSYEAQQLFPGQVAEIERLNQQIMGGTTVALSVIHNDRYTTAFFLSHTHTERGRRERERGRERRDGERGGTEGDRETFHPHILLFALLSLLYHLLIPMLLGCTWLMLVTLELFYAFSTAVMSYKPRRYLMYITCTIPLSRGGWLTWDLW